LKQRGRQPREERRHDQVEVNLLAENQGARAGRGRRGCALPFLGAGLLVLTLGALRTVLG
jgi:hypothetical protein